MPRCERYEGLQTERFGLMNLVPQYVKALGASLLNINVIYSCGEKYSLELHLQSQQSQSRKNPMQSLDSLPACLPPYLRTFSRCTHCAWPERATMLCIPGILLKLESLVAQERQRKYCQNSSSKPSSLLALLHKARKDRQNRHVLGCWEQTVLEGKMFLLFLASLNNK